MIGSSHTMYERPKGISTSGAPSSSRHALLTPTTNSPTHITIPQSPDERVLDRSSATSVSVSRSHPHSDPKSTPLRGEFSFSDEDSIKDSIPLVEDQGLDDLWDSLRQKKEIRMSKEKSKVKSLEPPSVTRSVTREPSEPARKSAPTPQKSVKKVKSLTTLQISEDGKSVAAFFDLKDVPKENVHVSFRPPRLQVSWFSETVTEFEDEHGRIVIERIQKDYQRVLPLPEGTKFEEIRGTMNGRHLVLRLPNCRSFRVERVFDEAEDID